WVAGKGQGYALTDEGRGLLQRGGDVQRALQRPKLVEIRPTSKEMSTWERGEVVRDAFLRPTPPIVTLTLVLLNGLVFCAGIGLASYRHVELGTYLAGNLTMGRLLPTGKDVGRDVASVQGLSQVYHDLGSLGPVDAFAHDQWWRLLTHGFVHSGFLHLLL